jgi:hypothetical protein
MACGFKLSRCTTEFTTERLKTGNTLKSLRSKRAGKSDLLYRKLQI